MANVIEPLIAQPPSGYIVITHAMIRLRSPMLGETADPNLALGGTGSRGLR